MNEPGNELLEIVLRECARLAPTPLYPGAFSQGAGVGRPQLDAALDQLRLGGLVRLTDWVQGQGQGYALTADGAKLLDAPRALDRLRRDGATPLPAAPPLRAVATDGATPWERGEAVRDALVRPSPPFVSLTLILLNVLVFSYGATLALRQKVPLNEYLNDFRRPNDNAQKVIRIQHDTGGLWHADVVNEDQWWRLLSYAFVQGGGLHLLMNMFFLYSLGPLVETIFGRARFLGLYLTGALGGGAAVVLARSNAVGASGALCGLLAALVVWVFANRGHLPPPIAAAWLRSLLMNVLLIVFISMMPEVSTAGHLGGGIAGAAFTLPFLWERYHSGIKRWLGLMGMVAVPLASVGLVALDLRADAQSRIAVAAKNAAVKAYNHHAVPLLKKPPASLFEDAIAVSEAQAAFREAQAKLQVALRLLDEDEPQAPNLQQARHHLRAWQSFFTAFLDVLEDRREWNLEERRALIQQANEIVRSAEQRQ